MNAEVDKTIGQECVGSPISPFIADLPSYVNIRNYQLDDYLSWEPLF